MNFIPMTEEEIQVSKLMIDGTYNYEVIGAVEKIDKNKNPFMSLTLLVWDDQGKEHSIFTNTCLIKLLKHFCDVNGLEEKYKSGTMFTHDFMNKCGGKVVIGTEGEKPKDGGGTFPAKNIVKDYVLSEGGMKPLLEVKNELNDDIPF